MKTLSAFVGHSFTKEDEAVVSTFLDFLTSLQHLNFGFSWDHAEDAEPKELSDKVKAKMEGKNLFIGICTAKEYAAGLNEAKTPFFNKGVAQFEKHKLVAKTSDWVMQEIGYALGKGMDIVLLLEDGARKPGGLQGDLEYIPFTRGTTSDAFPKLLEMIRALTPKALPPTPLGAVATPPSEKEGGAPEGTEKAQTKESAEDPQPGWTFDDYESAIFRAIFDKDEVRVEVLRDSFAKSAAGADALSRDLLEASALSLLSTINRGGNVDRLQELAAAHLSDRRFLNHLADAYAEYGLHDKAAANYIAAFNLSENDEQRLYSLTSAALQKMEGGDSRAEAWLRAEYSKLGQVSESLRSRLLWGLSILAEKRGAMGLWFAYQEARLHARPDDHDARFEVAFKYSEADNQVMALYHYLRIPVDERKESAWNNIGAAARSVNLKIQSTSSYQRSKKLGGTRAVSNLAYILIEEGFISEAQEMCNEALKKPDCDGRVGSALGSIEERRTSENESRKKILENADKERTFMAELGMSLTASVPANLDGSVWRTVDCDVTVSVKDGNFRASGTFSRVSGGILLAAMYQQSGLEQKKTTMLATYEGEIQGRGCVVKKVIREEGSKDTLLTTPTGDAVVLIIEEGLESIRELRKSEKSASIYSNWVRR